MKRKEMIELARRVVFPNKYTTPIDNLLRTLGIDTFGNTESAKRFLFQTSYWNK